MTDYPDFIALLSVPCFIAEAYTKRLGTMMALSCALSAVFCVAWLFLSYALNLSEHHNAFLRGLFVRAVLGCKIWGKGN